MRRAVLFTALITCSLGWAQLTPYKPTADELRENYRRADTVGNQAAGQVLNLNVSFVWIGNDAVAFRKQTAVGVHEFVKVPVKSPKESPLFDHVKLAKSLSDLTKTEIKADRLPINLTLATNEIVRFSHNQKSYDWNLKTETLAETSSPERPNNPRFGGNVSPDRKWVARIQEGKLEIRPANENAVWMPIGKATNLVRINWSPDSKFILVQSQIPGDRKQVSTLNSTIKDATRAELKTRLYDQPGDKLDMSEIYSINVEKQIETKIEIDPIICGGHPWSSPPGIEWWQPKGHSAPTALIDFSIRGFQEHKILEINPATAEVMTWVDEVSPTFIHLSQLFWQKLPTTRGLVWRSERTGWANLYLYTGPGAFKPITNKNFVVRAVQDLTDKQVIFSANHLEAGDPYFIHYYKANLDGTGFTKLTEATATHTASWSPDNQYFVDTYSTVTNAPVSELRNVDGKKLATLLTSDVTPVRKAGITGPVEFIAKGRDGKTDIYGLITFPTHFDKTKSYPVIEDIYAGPHDSFVPKSFRPVFWYQRLAELGFIVVQVDGMGTANRGKAFHDVCWKNIADAGFPDRIAWMKAAAQKYPQMDLSKVGIYGTSAGGQNSTGALLFHPEFYKVAVSSCGCHDNRMDKFWWNEQWMGYPVGDHYDQQSNITNASKLKGDLLLMVGEVDTNVPPESTFRLADALIKAGKEFDFVYLPGTDHTSGGAFGEHKRRDFFVKHLLGVDPPRWN